MRYKTISGTYREWKIIPSEEINFNPEKIFITFEYFDSNNFQNSVKEKKIGVKKNIEKRTIGYAPDSFYEWILDDLEDSKNSKAYSSTEEMMKDLMSD